MKKSTVIKAFVYSFFSFLFTIQSIVYINDSGDQTWFANAAKQFGFFEFAWYRYQTWSSRLLIESVTMFMSSHYLIFDITLFISLILFFFCTNNILEFQSYRKLNFVIFPILFFVAWPSLFFTSAGLIATITNYLFPLVSLVIAWDLIIRRKIVTTICSIPFLIFACMQEQFTVFIFLYTLFTLIYQLIKNNKTSFYLFFCNIFSLLGILSALFAPGSRVRLAQEIDSWYPNFDNIPFFVKILKGYMETNRVIFVSNELNSVFILLILIILVSIFRRKILQSIVSITILYTMIMNKLGIDNFFTATQKVNEQQSAIADDTISRLILNLYPLVIYTVLLLALSFIIVSLFTNQADGLNALIILASGYAARMIVSLSPTIYASGLRTFTPLVFSFLLISVILIKEIMGKSHFNESLQ